MEILVEGNGQIFVDGVPAGGVVYAAPAESGRIDLGDRTWSFRLRGPFGEGYNLELSAPRCSHLQLSYNWREGTEVTEDGELLDLSEAGTKLSRHGELLASVSWTSRYVRVRIPDPIQIYRGFGYAAFLALGRMYADKTGVFSRHPRA